MNRHPERHAVRVVRLSGAEAGGRSFGYCHRCLERPVWFVDSGLPTGRSIRVYCNVHLPAKHRAAADKALPA